VNDAAARNEVDRLEGVWSGDFGDEYVDRNLETYDLREPFWTSMTTRLAPQRLLEVGCNAGGNLRFIEPAAPDARIYGIDINRKALGVAQQFLPDGNFSRESASDLPFRDGWFDLVFTMGVLIHQPEESIRTVLSEIARTSSRYVLSGEVFAPETTPIPYRGLDAAFFKRDYGKLFVEVAPELSLVDTGELGKDDGFDTLHWWLFEKL
jgi:pseudaminic acid biosynthesis-associated methylase